MTALTLGEIIETVRDGGKPDYEDLRYAICAMEALATFDRMAFMRLADAEKNGKKPFMTSSAQWQFEESFNRARRAMGKPPKQYVGRNNDPDNPEFIARRQRSKRIASASVDKAKP